MNLEQESINNMEIKFENGSTIESMESSESKRSRGCRFLINPIDDCCDYIKGKRMTDEEYRRFLYREQVNAEYNMEEVIKELGL